MKQEYKGYTIDVIEDEDPISPSDWANEDCFLVFTHRDFEVRVEGFKPYEIYEHVNKKENHWFYKGYFVFELFAYIHSGVYLSTRYEHIVETCQHASWDTSNTGFVLVKRMPKWSYTRQKAYVIADEVVKEWNQYLGSDVYGYRIEDKDGNEIDSCWGFYGNPEESGLLDEAKSIIDNL